MDVEVLEPEKNDNTSQSKKRWTYNLQVGGGKGDNHVYSAGILMALGMNLYKSGFSLALLWSVFSWADVGYLLMELLSKAPTG